MCSFASDGISFVSLICMPIRLLVLLLTVAKWCVKLGLLSSVIPSSWIYSAFRIAWLSILTSVGVAPSPVFDITVT